MQIERDLIRGRARASTREPAFAPFASRVGTVPYVDYVGYVMHVGYEDFPPP